jgi:hypothetical protein
MHPHLRQREQVVEPERGVGRRPLQQGVEQLGSGRRVGKGAVHRFGFGVEVAGKGAELHVLGLVACKTARERDGVDAVIAHARVRMLDERGVEERAVESNVVADDHRIVRELDPCGQYLVDCGRRPQHVVGDAGQRRDLVGDRHARVHERVERAEHLAAAQLERAHFGDGVAAARRAAGRLEIDDHERHVVQRRRKVGGHAADAIERMFGRAGLRCDRQVRGA